MNYWGRRNYDDLNIDESSSSQIRLGSSNYNLAIVFYINKFRKERKCTHFYIKKFRKERESTRVRHTYMYKSIIINVCSFSLRKCWVSILLLLLYNCVDNSSFPFLSDKMIEFPSHFLKLFFWHCFPCIERTWWHR